jgi:hypothetical protein
LSTSNRNCAPRDRAMTVSRNPRSLTSHCDMLAGTWRRGSVGSWAQPSGRYSWRHPIVAPPGLSVRLPPYRRSDPRTDRSWPVVSQLVRSGW